MIAIALFFARMLCDCCKSRRQLEAEILVLRHQLNVLRQRAPRRLYLRWADRVHHLSLLKNVIWLEIGSRVKIGMRIFINRMEHLVSLVRAGHLNPFGRHCIRTPRLQGGKT
jgi:hypothetical protein